MAKKKSSHDRATGPQAWGISKISVSGFKSISEETAIDIRPLTVLAGPNSSGKSSQMQPLLLLKQTLEAQYDPGSLLIDGSHVKFTSTSQFLSKSIVNDTPSKTMTVEVDVGSESTRLTFFKSEDTPVEVIEMTRTGFLFLNSGRQKLKTWKIQTNESSDELRKTFETLEEGHPFIQDKRAKFSVTRDRCFLSVNATIQFESGGPTGTYRIDPGMSDYARREILRMIHLPGLRGNPERTYPLVPTGRVFPGLFQYYAASVIHAWVKSNELEKLNRLNKALDLLELQSNISTEEINETQVGVWVSRTSENLERDRVSIADVGLAVSQVLPVLVALIVAEPGQLVYIEQPEIHLHPRAQWKLAQLIVDTANRAVKLVIETHSSLLLRGIQTCIAKRIISPDRVALHWFERGSDGNTSVSTADLDEEGQFGEWPTDFDDVELTASNDYLDAVETKLIPERK
jgi:predicted ATPase